MEDRVNPPMGPQIPFHTGNRLVVFSLTEKTQSLLESKMFPDLLTATLSGEEIGKDAFCIYAYNDEEQVWYKSRFDDNWMESILGKISPDTGSEAFRVIYVAGVGVTMHLQPWLLAASRGTRTRFIFQDMVEVVNAFQPMALGVRKSFRKDMFVNYVDSLLGAVEDCKHIKGMPSSEEEKSYLAHVKAWVDVFNPRRELIKTL